MTNARIVLTTAPSLKVARRIAGVLVARRLAACVNIVPGVESVYRWKGRVERAREWLLVTKTTKVRVRTVERTIRDEHPYELPECLVFSVEGGSRDYLGWIRKNVG